MSFERNETWNLGQMVRATFPEQTHIVGFYTFKGQVLAAERWGGPHRARDLVPAFAESYEAKLHELKVPRLYFHTNVDDEDEDESASHPYHHKNFKTPYKTPPPKLPCMYVRIHDDVIVTSTLVKFSEPQRSRRCVTRNSLRWSDGRVRVVVRFD